MLSNVSKGKTALLECKTKLERAVFYFVMNNKEENRRTEGGTTATRRDGVNSVSPIMTRVEVGGGRATDYERNWGRLGLPHLL